MDNPPLRVVAPFITAPGFFYFQRRSPDPRRGAAGLLGTFGGKVEPNESDVEAAAREVSEETTLRLGPAAFSMLGEYDVLSDNDLKEVQIHMVAFLVELESTEPFGATDGCLVVLPAARVAAHLGEMTPGTREGWCRYLARRYS